MSRAFAAATAWLPKGWGDAGRQLGILVGVDLIYELGRGVADSQRADAIHHGAQVIDFERSTHTLLRAQTCRSSSCPPTGPIDIANYLYLNAQFSIALGFLIWLYLFRNESYYFVRNMFVVVDVPGADRLHRLPDRAAADVPRSDGFVDTMTKYSAVNSDSVAGQGLHQPLRGGAEHALRLRADDRRHRRRGLPPLVVESLLGLLADPDRLGRDRHRQPLLGRLGARLAGRARLLRDRQRRAGALETRGLGLAPASRAARRAAGGRGLSAARPGGALRAGRRPANL